MTTLQDELASALRGLLDAAHAEVSPTYSAELDDAFTIADNALARYEATLASTPEAVRASPANEPAK